ncbi:MAG: nucleotidyltransferase domain-containing protein [Candidatus Hydrogenedentes bacterium]|nr:nucleotidyltransferase domain-containing protein [Candidatus Hydrogenedentota bacterium]
MSQPRIAIPQEQIEAFCRKWRVREFSLFGSVLRDDFRPDSDVDVLVSFQEHPEIGLWDISEMAEELEGLYARKVDLVIKEGLNNPFRRKEILDRREILYAA